MFRQVKNTPANYVRPLPPKKKTVFSPNGYVIIVIIPKKNYTVCKIFATKIIIEKT